MECVMFTNLETFNCLIQLYLHPGPGPKLPKIWPQIYMFKTYENKKLLYLLHFYFQFDEKKLEFLCEINEISSSIVRF